LCFQIVHIEIDSSLSIASENVFVWKFEGNELFMDLEEDVRFRIVEESFVDANPLPPSEEKANILSSESSAAMPKVPPYSLIVGR